MSRFTTSTLIAGLALTTPALLTTTAHADQTAQPADAKLTPTTANETSVSTPAPASNTNANQLPSTTSDNPDESSVPNATNPASTALNGDGNQLTGSTTGDDNNLNENQTTTPTTAGVDDQTTPLSPVTTTATDQPVSSTAPVNLPVVNLIQTTTPTVNDAIPDQTDAFLKAGSVSPSGGMNSDEIIKEAQNLGLNAVTVSLLTNFGDLHGDHPTINQADWDKMAANVTALQAKGYKVIIQLYPVINDLRDVETAWAPANKDRFFTQYDQLLERTARFAEAHHVYGMYLATNLVQTEQYEDDWETAIQKVRALYHGQLFFRTNWWYYADWAPDTVTNYNNLLNRKFWKDVDVISIAAYFELTAKPNPTSEDLQKALYDVPYNNRHQNVVAQIKALHDKWHKPIFFGELGIPPHPLAASQPWSTQNAAHTSQGDQVVANWFDAFYQVFSKYDWWKGYSIFTIDDAGSWYNPYQHPAATTIKNQSIEATAAYKAAQPQTQDVSATDPGARTQVTRTIRVIDPQTQAAQTINQIVQFHRTATKNLRTGAVTYGAWQVNGNSQWAQYQVPTRAGYQPSVATVAAQTPTATTSPIAVTIIYQAQPQTVTVRFIDDEAHGQIIKTQRLTGVTDQTLLLPLNGLDHYQANPGNPTHYQLTAHGDQTVDLHFTHQHERIIDHHSVTRTIQVQDPRTNQLRTLTTQTVTLTRPVDHDLVTNTKTSNENWSMGEFQAVTPPEFTGYHVTNYNDGQTRPVTITTPNQTVVFTYAKDTPTVTNQIRWVDNDTSGHPTIKTQTLTGPEGSQRELRLTVPDHYHSLTSWPKMWTLQANHDLIIHLTHQRQDLTDQATTHRKVQMLDPTTNQTKVLADQVIHFTHTGYHDLVTDQTHWDNWETKDAIFPAVSAPHVAGYRVINGDAALRQALTQPGADQTVTFKYQSHPSQLVVRFIDHDDYNQEVINAETVAGQPGQTQALQLHLPAHYHVIDPRQLTYTFQDQDQAELRLLLGHDHQTVTDHQPVTRTVQYLNPVNQVWKNLPNQTTTITRHGDVDLVTNQTTWQAWSTPHFPTPDLPVIAGYTANTVDPTATGKVVVTYHANPATSVPGSASHDSTSAHSSNSSVASSASSVVTISTSSAVSSAVSSASSVVDNSTTVTPSSAVSSASSATSSAQSTGSSVVTSSTTSTSASSHASSAGEVTSSVASHSTTTSASSAPSASSSTGEVISSAVTTSSAESSSVASASSTVVSDSSSSVSNEPATHSSTTSVADSTNANSSTTMVVSSAATSGDMVSTSHLTTPGNSIATEITPTISPVLKTVTKPERKSTTPVGVADQPTTNHPVSELTQASPAHLPQTGNHLAQTATLLGLLGLSLALGSLHQRRRD